MVPVQLSLRNFMSYGEDVPPLDFSHFHVACLSGSNGHGKSALLDAITWTVWGEARKGAGARKADDGLVRIGSTEMRTELVFDLEGDRYRVIRRYRKTKSGGAASLEFQLYDAAGGRYVPLSEGSSLAKTQARINRTLRMDYETFINSACILQGRADEFTRKGARERKQILAEVLGLRQYDELANLAKRHAQEAERECLRCEAALGEMGAELAHKAEYKAEVDALDAKLETVSETIEGRQTVLSRLRDARTELLGRQREVKSLDGQIDQAERNLQEMRQLMDRQSKEVEAFRAVMAQQKDTEARWGHWKRLSALDEELTGKLGTLRSLEAERGRVEQDIQEARHQIEARRQGLQAGLEGLEETARQTEEIISRAGEIERGYSELGRARKEAETWQARKDQIEELEGRARALEKAVESAQHEVRVALDGLNHRLEELQARARRESEARTRLEEAQQRLSHLEAAAESDRTRQEGVHVHERLEAIREKIRGHEHEMAQIREKQKLLEDNPEARCPLCESELDDRKRETIEQRYSVQIQEHGHQIAALEAEVVALQERLAALRQAYRDAQEQLEALPKARREAAALESAHAEVLAAAEEIAQVEQQRSALSRRLDEGQAAGGPQRELEAVRRSIEEVGYDPQLHQEARRAVEDLGRFEQDKAQLDAAQKQRQRTLQAVPGLKQEIAEADRSLQAKAYAQQQRVQWKDLSQRISALGYDEQEHQGARETLRSLSQAPVQMEQLRQAQERLSPALEALTELHARVQRQTGEQNRLREQLEASREALGRLPGLEQEIQESEAHLEADRSVREQTLQERGGMQSRYDRCVAMEIQRRELEGRRKEAQRGLDLYEKLRIAFGKDGIQALIIENALPEIEEEANAILRQLTDQRTQISIEPLRDLKSGGTKETLDIKISDEMGTRSYEMYSGGEAFRTDFALRIALSKLLAKRAGTKLRTLVVDEGFGTQDAEGLEHLVEAIQTISPDFDKILVVTHLAALKNAFPVQIEVTKYPQIGSRFEVRKYG